MSAAAIARALTRLAAPGAVLADDRKGGYGLYPRGDRRRRPLSRLTAHDVRELEAQGVITRVGDDCFALSSAGAARVRREVAPEGEGFAVQHGEIVDRAVMDADGAVRVVRGFDAERVLRRLAGLRDGAGKPWLSAAELSAATQLRRSWDLSQAGLVRGSDWTAAPLGSGARGGGNVQEAAMARRCDAGRRVADALAALAPALRRVVERVCLAEEGLEALERAEGWPARSGKLALKLGLAQLAAGVCT